MHKIRKAFAFLTSPLSRINKSSKEAKSSTQPTSPDIQKENNKSSNFKNDKNDNIRKNNYDTNPLNKIKKKISNDFKKPTSKKSPSELRKSESKRKTSSKTASSTTVSTLKHSSSNHRKKLLHANYYNPDLPIILENENFHLQLHHRHRQAYWNEYEYDDYNPSGYYYDEMNDGYAENRIINIPNVDLSNTPSIEKIRRISLNTSSSRPRNDSFSKMYSGLTTTRRSNDSNRLVAGANPPPPNKYQKEATKTMTTSEYHKYQQEMVAVQYLKHGISPMIDDPISVHNPRGPTLIQVQSMMNKRLSVIDRGYSGSYTSPAELARKNSCTRTVSDYSISAGNGGINSHRRTHSESNMQISSRHHHHYYYNTPLHLQHQSHHSSISSSSSGSTYVSSGGPPTPTSRSSMMFNSNVYGSRPNTPSSGSGYIFPCNI